MLKFLEGQLELNCTQRGTRELYFTELHQVSHPVARSYRQRRLLSFCSPLHPHSQGLSGALAAHLLTRALPSQCRAPPLGSPVTTVYKIRKPRIPTQGNHNSIGNIHHECRNTIYQVNNSFSNTSTEYITMLVTNILNVVLQLQITVGATSR